MRSTGESPSSASRGARVVLTTSAYAISIGGEPYNRPIRALTRCGNGLVRLFAAQHSAAAGRPPAARVSRSAIPAGTVLFGAPLRPDGMHYRGPGAELVGAWILHQLGITATPA